MSFRILITRFLTLMPESYPQTRAKLISYKYYKHHFVIMFLEISWLAIKMRTNRICSIKKINENIKFATKINFMMENVYLVFIGILVRWTQPLVQL